MVGNMQNFLSHDLPFCLHTSGWRQRPEKHILYLGLCDMAEAIAHLFFFFFTANHLSSSHQNAPNCSAQPGSAFVGFSDNGV